MWIIIDVIKFLDSGSTLLFRLGCQFEALWDTQNVIETRY
jgi:hypothetical protein